MLDATLESWARWWDGVPAPFVFLLALPVAVAVAGLIRMVLRSERQRHS